MVILVNDWVLINSMTSISLTGKCLRNWYAAQQQQIIGGPRTDTPRIKQAGIVLIIPMISTRGPLAHTVVCCDACKSRYDVIEVHSNVHTFR